MLKNGYRWITYHSCKHECLTITQATDSECRVNYILAALGNGFGLVDNNNNRQYVILICMYISYITLLWFNIEGDIRYNYTVQQQ